MFLIQWETTGWYPTTYGGCVFLCKFFLCSLYTHKRFHHVSLFSQLTWSLVFYDFFPFVLLSRLQYMHCSQFPKTPGRPSVQSHSHLLLWVLGPKGNWQWLPASIPFQNHEKLVWYKYYNIKLVPVSVWTLPGFCSYDYSSFLKSQLCKGSKMNLN